MRISLLLLLISLSASLLAQTPKQRVIAEATYNNSVLSDSSVYKYSSTRHSKTDFVSLNWYYFMANAQGGDYTPLSVINGVVVPNNIDSLQYARVADFDTLYYFKPDAGGSTYLERIYTCDYYPDGKLRRASDNWYTDVDYIYYYGDMYRSRRVFGKQDTNWHFYVRDAFGNVVIDSANGDQTPSWAFFLSFKFQFEFDSLNRYTSRTEYWGSSFPDNRTEYEYYPHGKVKQFIMGYIRPSDGAFVGGLADSFGYTPGVPGYTSRNFFYRGSRLSIFRDSTHVNSRGLVDTLVRIRWGGQQSQRMETITVQYNSAGNPIVLTLADFRGITTHYYYYEDYSSSLSAGNTGPSAPVFPIFLSPNPTTGKLTVSCNTTCPQTPLTVRVSDMMGQLKQVENLTLQGGKADMMLSDAGPGCYYISVYEGAGKMLYRGTILKR